MTMAILVSVLGRPSGAHPVLDAFDHAWLVTGAIDGHAALGEEAWPTSNNTNPTRRQQ
jgi:hypothetical protein